MNRFTQLSEPKGMLKKSTSFYGTKHFLSSILNIPWVYLQKQTLHYSPPSVSILEALCSDGDLTEALIEMGKQGVKMGFKDYNSLLNECIKQRAIREGQRLHAHMIKTLYRPAVFLRTRLIVFYVKCELLGDARWVFDEMPERNVVAWTAMISAYAQRGNFFEALDLFVQMLRSGMEPNEFTFATVLTSCMGTFGLQFGRQIHSLLIKTPFASHMYVGSSLLDMYAKAGRVHEARLVFAGLPERDVVSCTAMISGFSQQGLYEDAIDIFCKLQGEGMPSNYVTYISLLNAISGLAAIEHGRQVHGHVIRSELPFYVVLQNSLIDMYSKCGNLIYARRIFDSMSERTVSTWNTMLVGYSKHGMGREAVDLFRKMREEDETSPDSITLLAVLSGCSHGGMEETGLDIFNELVAGEHKVDLGMEHYGCVVDLLGRSGQVERAYQFIQQMPFEPSTSILGSVLGACSFHLNVDIGELVGNRLLEIEPGCAGNYVILSNIYASTGRWGDARRVRKLMEEKSVVKEPGMSCV
nr:putative pentatricopeptide repeat-containing protein At3g13770, mitochondrial [Ipomoea batatas]